MRFYSLLAAFGVLILAPVALLVAGTMGCNEYVPATIDIKPVFEEITYDTTQPMLKIKALAESSTGGTQSESWPVGLSTGELYLNIVKDVYKIRSPYDAATCGQIKALHIEIGFAKNTIYVAKEFPKRSCPYRIVLGHEEKHKQVDRELLDDYTEKARTFFSDAAKKIGAVRSGSGAAIDGQIGDSLTEAMDQFTNDLESDRKRRQKEVDSNEEYARVSASCEGDLMQIVNERLALLEETQPGITKKMDGKGHTTASPATTSRPANTGF